MDKCTKRVVRSMRARLKAENAYQSAKRELRYMTDPNGGWGTSRQHSTLRQRIRKLELKAKKATEGFRRVVSACPNTGLAGLKRKKSRKSRRR